MERGKTGSALLETVPTGRLGPRAGFSRAAAHQRYRIMLDQDAGQLRFVERFGQIGVAAGHGAANLVDGAAPAVSMTTTGTTPWRALFCLIARQVW